MRTASRAAMAATVATLGLVALSGCNTVRGLGQDTQAGGRAVERSADETQQQIEERRRREQDQQQNPGAPPPGATTTPPS